MIWPVGSAWCFVFVLSTSSAVALKPRQPCDLDCVGYDVAKVLKIALNISSHSWEYGTASEALLELKSPELSVFSPAAFPGGKIPKPRGRVPSLEYARQHINLTNGDTLIDGDGASGDPASLGVSALLLGQKAAEYRAAADRQASHLLSSVPRLSNGAISQRDSAKQAWADFVYMAPPFLAYYAVATANVTLMKEVVRQCGLYRQLLQVRRGNWKHIVVETEEENSAGEDDGLWSTGNAWAAAGMARVLATISHWPATSSSLQSERADLTEWIREIVAASRTQPLADGGLLRNYLNDTSWFGETSGTALLASVTYRMAVLAPGVFTDDYTRWADARRAAVAAHVTGNGTLSPSVNPLGWGDRKPFTAGSPEGQSFGVLLAAAYRDYRCTGSS